MRIPLLALVGVLPKPNTTPLLVLPITTLWFIDTALSKPVISKSGDSHQQHTHCNTTHPLTTSVQLLTTFRYQPDDYYLYYIVSNYLLAVVHYSKYPPDFVTVTCLEWKRILADDAIKDIVVGSLRFLVSDERINLYAFVIMNNHRHLIWQMRGNHERENVQRDFLKYTGQQILLYLKRQRAPILAELIVNAKDRRCQVWERNSLSVSLYSFGVFMQKLNYIHRNPVVAGLCSLAEDYGYSSAAFYQNGDCRWDFLTHFNG